MTTSVELSVGLLRRFAEFTKKLSPEELEALVAGELKFGLLVPPTPKVVKQPVEADKLAAELGSMTSREEATAHIDRLKLTSDQLKKLAKEIGASVAGITRKDGFRDRIVEHTLGYRLNSQTIRHGSWSSQ
jgi:hypothetical protein